MRELGADAAVGYGEPAPPWDEPVDLVLDGAGGPALSRGIAALAPFGRLVSYSAAGGSVEVNDLRGQSRSIVGFAVANLMRHSPRAYAEHGEQLWRMAAEGSVCARVHAELPLASAAEAHRIVESRQSRGKVLLRP
nr:zinc-binding dehydrogenase [Fodinicola acaciae]